MGTLEDELDMLRGDIISGLNEFHAKKLEDVQNKSPEIQGLYEVIGDMSTGGKQARGILTKQFYLGLVDEPIDNYINIALAVEEFQNSVLIHDDIMDGTKLRRKEKTVHVKMAELNGRNDETYGKSMAIMAGSLCYNFGLELLSQIPCAPEVNKKMMDAYIATYEITAHGQIRDISNFRDTDPEEYFKTILEKTTYYTAFLPIDLACILAGTPQEEIESFKKPFEDLFAAFQIYDDILDCFPVKPDKEPGTDIREGKPTLLVLNALQNASETQLKEMFRILGKRNATKEAIKVVTDILEDTGSLQYCRDVTHSLHKIALDGIKTNQTLKKDTKKFLYGFADWLINRDF